MTDDKTQNWIIMAETAQDGKNYEEAISYYNKILEKEANNSEAWLNKGFCVLLKMDWNIDDDDDDVKSIELKFQDNEMNEVISNFKNAIKFSNNSEIKKTIAEKLNSKIMVLEEQIVGCAWKDKTAYEDGCKILEEGFAFGLECDDKNESLCDNALSLIYGCHKVVKDLGFKSHKTERLNYVKSKSEKYIKAKKTINPEWEPESLEKSSTGGCFIATATMGDYNHPTVLQLRYFRDDFIIKRSWGRNVINFYYRWSPYLAKIIKKSNVLRKLSYYILVKPLSFIASKIIKDS